MSLFKKLMDILTDPKLTQKQAIDELETHRGQGQDDTVDHFKKVLQSEIDGDTREPWEWFTKK
jgi:hypothetical protein